MDSDCCGDGAGAMSSLTMSGGEPRGDCASVDHPGSPLSPSMSSTRRRRSAQKRVVTVPLANDGEGGTPSTDSWAWRKYGQKPIKGSPYPRAYYRCSSSKGCPAKKRVERSRVDPAMVVVTYSSEHNHAGPVPRAQSRQSQKPKPQPGPPEPAKPEDALAKEAAPVEVHDEFRWFHDVVSVASRSPSDECADDMLYGPVFLDAALSTAMLLPDECGGDVRGLGGEGSEEDALFAGLGELPECAMVFRRHGRGDGLEGRVKVEQPPEGTAMS